MSMMCRPKWPFLHMYGPHDMRLVDFRGLTGSQRTPRVWGVTDDEELRRACEAAIEGTKQKVVMTIRVAKSRGIWGKSGKLGRNMAKPRVLALSSM